MVPLKDYIRKCESKFDMYDWSREICYFFEENDLHEIDILPKYPFKLGYDYIYETLKSHDVQKLKSRIEKEFSNDILDISIENKEDKYGMLVVKFEDSHLGGFLSEKFKLFDRIINFFGYSKNLDSDNYWCIDPDMPEKCNKEVDDLFNYRFFHVAPKCYEESILRNGLRIKEKSKEGYRKYPRRIQLKGSKPKDKQELLKFAKELKDQRKEKDPKWKEAVVFMVDLRDARFDVYRDHAYSKEEDCYFIYNNVHPSDIRKLYEI